LNLDLEKKNHGLHAALRYELGCYQGIQGPNYASCAVICKIMISADAGATTVVT
jgi:hypothetical protein